MTSLFQRIGGPLVALWALSGMALILATAYKYLYWTGFGEQGIVTFATASWLLAQDQPLYTAVDAAERYSLQHGPLIYLIISWSMKLLGPSFFSAKLPGVLFFTLVLALAGLWLLKRLDFKQAFFLFGLQCWILGHWQYEYYSRPDSLLLLLLTVITLFVATNLTSRLQLILLAFFCGLLINLKIHAIIYFFPVLALLWQKRLFTWCDFAICFIVASLTAVIPFFHPAISFGNYFLWLNASLLHHYTLQNFLPKLAVIILLTAITLCLAAIVRADLHAFYKKHRLFLATLLGSMLLVSLVASKSGSGTNHLIPFIPLVVYIMVLILNAEEKRSLPYFKHEKATAFAVLAIILLLITVSGAKKELTFWNRMSPASHQALLLEYNKVRTTYPDKSIAIGEGVNNRVPYYRDLVPLPVFQGHPFLVDSVALGDMNASGIQIPRQTLQALETGKIQIWLIPSGQKPFATGAYSSTFQTTFLENYFLAEQGTNFDIWLFRDKN